MWVAVTSWAVYIANQHFGASPNPVPSAPAPQPTPHRWTPEDFLPDAVEIAGLNLGDESRLKRLFEIICNRANQIEGNGQQVQTEGATK
jgi:hypothetical protein